MKEIKFSNAIVRITLPTEKQQENIRKATETFLRQVIKERIRTNGNNNTSRIV